MLDFYSVIAELYEQFQDFDMNKLPELWASFLNDEYNKTTSVCSELSGRFCKSENRLALDLGCGTGSITLALAEKGWRVIGIDNSPEMLEVANSKINCNIKNNRSVSDEESLEDNLEIKFMLQDILNLELKEQADLIYTSLDVFNHLDEDELLEVLQNSYKQLKDKGVFIFDLHSLEYMQNDLGNNIYHSVTDDHVIIWENDFSESDLSNEAVITVFKKGSDGMHKRECSSLLEYYHYPKLVIEYLEFLGMKVELIENTDFTDMWDGKRIFIKASKNL